MKPINTQKNVIMALSSPLLASSLLRHRIISGEYEQKSDNDRPFRLT
jgi:hypothetical protein